MKVLIVFLLSFSTSARAENNNPIIFHVHGGAMQSYKNDRVQVSPEGKITLSTISPTFAEYPNLIGQFTTEISLGDLEKFQKDIKAHQSSITTPGHEPTGGAIVEELHFGDNKTFWTSREDSKPINTIRSAFLVLAKQAYKNPIKALSLSCSQDKKQIQCSYKNVGKEAVDTIDPLGVSYSIACLDIRGQKKILHELTEFNPKKMTPKRIIIQPGLEYNFAIQTDRICDYRVVVKTTDIMINRDYQNVLLGELVSNQLRK